MDARNQAVVIFEGLKEHYWELQLRELNELQLAFVGGGFGDTIL